MEVVKMRKIIVDLENEIMEIGTVRPYEEFLVIEIPFRSTKLCYPEELEEVLREMNKNYKVV